jgi:hypothetical protein
MFAKRSFCASIVIGAVLTAFVTSVTTAAPYPNITHFLEPGWARVEVRFDATAYPTLANGVLQATQKWDSVINGAGVRLSFGVYPVDSNNRPTIKVIINPQLRQYDTWVDGVLKRTLANADVIEYGDDVPAKTYSGANIYCSRNYVDIAVINIHPDFDWEADPVAC